MPNPKKPRSGCLHCGKEQARASYKYCSNACQLVYQHQIYINKWKKGEERGLQGLGIVSTYIKKYLRKKYGDKCCLCGWSEINPKTRKVPLVSCRPY